ncbi:MAG TPA: type I-E CRISPR-associated protein Cse2/CasB [Armatimonadota bacterium]|nr:type I-E CRISPR-associated protein Cse2/CasB [Armatimonadota bacterium]
MSEETQKDDPEIRFIERVEKLDNGALAQLRRAAGDRMGDRPELLWFAGMTRGRQTEAADFLVATLLAQYKTATIRSGGHRRKGNFGATWKSAIGPSPSDSIRRRFHILLNSDLGRDGSGDLPYRLRQMVRYAAAKGVGLDWAQLLKDLNRWHFPERWAQKEWARSFFSGSSDSDDKDRG